MSWSSLGYRWLCLAPFFALAWQALASFGPWRNPWLRLNFTLAFGAALAVLFPVLLGTLHFGFLAALWGGAGLALACTLALRLQAEGGVPKGDWKIPWTWRSLPFLLWFVFLTTMICLVALKYSFHDQTKIQVHPSLIESIQRGNFPPHLQVFPDIPLKYHFGADFFVAILSYVTGLPGWQALDILQIMGWVLAFSGVYGLSREFGLKPLPAFLAANWFLLTAGWTYLLQPWLNAQEWGLNYPLIWPDAYPVFQRYLDPGVISWFFQTPYALGIPLFLAALGMIYFAFTKGGLKAWLWCGIALGTLSVIQVALFFTLLTATLATIALRFWLQPENRRPAAASWLLLAGISLALAFLLGGFFETSPDYSKGLLVFHARPSYLDYAFHAGRRPISWPEALKWYLCSFGSLCFLSPLTLAFGALHFRRPFRPEIAIFGGIALVSFVLPQFFYYQLSWDIIKWFAIFQMASVVLILLVGDIVFQKKTWYCLALLPLIALDVIPSLRLLYGLSFLKASDYQGKPRGWFLAVIHPPTPEVQYFATEFRKRPWNEAVLSSLDWSTLFSIHSGQAMAIPDYNTVAFGVTPARLQARNRWIQQLREDFSAEKMRESPVRWVIYSCAEFDKTFSPKSKQAMEEAVVSGALISLQPPGNGCWKAYRLRAD